jgi:hypothetical protein
MTRSRAELEAKRASYREQARGKCYAMSIADWEELDEQLRFKYNFVERTNLINQFLKDKGYEK